MQGYKRAVEEGGIRNWLAVQGPGVQGGVIDSTLLDITDVVPTVADLAGVPEGSGGRRLGECCVIVKAAASLPVCDS
jgi:arylsulfatase A-like enzyme